MKKVLTCLITSRGESIVDYALLKECDASMVATFKIAPLSLDLDHNPSTLQQKTYTLTNALEYETEEVHYVALL